MGRRTGTLLLWTAVLAWAGVIFTLSAQPGSRLPGGWSVQGHFGVYAVLGVLLWLALGGRSAGVRGIVLAIVIASAYGITDEFHQSFVPQRTPDVFDWATDTVGAAVGVMLAWYFAGALERRRARPATSGEEATDADAGQARDAD